MMMSQKFVQENNSATAQTKRYNVFMFQINYSESTIDLQAAIKAFGMSYLRCKQSSVPKQERLGYT